MAYYAFVGKTCGVYSAWVDVQALIPQSPFCKYRKFNTQDEAWEFVSKNYKSSGSTASYFRVSPNPYELTVVCSVYMDSTDLYMNFFLPKALKGMFEVYDDIAMIKRSDGLITCRYRKVYYNKFSAIDNSRAVNRVLDIVGDYVMIDIEMDTPTMYYLERFYNGSNMQFLQVQKRVRDRGNVGWRVRNSTL